MKLLATTVPGLESVAAEEIDDLLGADAAVHHRGAVAFDADPAAVHVLNERARSLHRVLVVLTTGTIEELGGAYDLARTVPVEEYFAPGQAFAVRSSRHGTHDFTSVDVAERVGQALVDGSREAFGDRLPVDLDDPDVVVRAYVRNDRLVLAIDATGEESLHRRSWRVCDHHAPLKPTIAHAMCRLADYGPDDRLLDPMCGGGTLPIEAALWARGTRDRDRSFAADRLVFLPAEPTDGGQTPPPRPDSETGASGDVPATRGIDAREKWVRCARANVEAAGLTDRVRVEHGDATEAPLDADVIAVDLPFGVRTSEDLPALYSAFSENLQAGEWERFVGITTRPELLELEPARTVEIRYGRLDASILVVER